MRILKTYRDQIETVLVSVSNKLGRLIDTVSNPHTDRESVGGYQSHYERTVDEVGCTIRSLDDDLGVLVISNIGPTHHDIAPYKQRCENLKRILKLIADFDPNK